MLSCHPKMPRWLILFIVVASFTSTAPALAQIYPSKPVRLVSPFPPGGGSDAVARIVALALTERLNQQVIVDPRGGASGMIGTELVAKSPADGYTLLLGNLTPQSILPAAKKTLPYDPINDFIAVSLVATTDYVLGINPSVPARTLKELIALAKKSPGSLSYASSGNLGAPHLAGEYLSLLSGGKILHVPYKGTGPAAISVITGETMLMFGSAPAVLPHGKTGRLRIIATTGQKRSQPNLPTISEVLPDYVMTQWYGVIAPARTPSEIIERLHFEIAKINANQKMLDAYAAIGVEATTNTPDQFRSFLINEIKKWTVVIAKANISGD